MAISTTKLNSAHALMVAARFPGVTDFEIVHDPTKVQPVGYISESTRSPFGSVKEHLSYEYPPMARWRVRGQQFIYVAKPSFKTKDWEVLFMSGKTTTPDYSGEEQALMNCLRWSAEGKTAEEINKLL